MHHCFLFYRKILCVCICFCVPVVFFLLVCVYMYICVTFLKAAAVKQLTASGLHRDMISLYATIETPKAKVTINNIKRCLHFIRTAYCWNEAVSSMNLLSRSCLQRHCVGLHMATAVLVQACSLSKFGMTEVQYDGVSVCGVRHSLERQPSDIKDSKLARQEGGWLVSNPKIFKIRWATIFVHE